MRCMIVRQYDGEVFANWKPQGADALDATMWRAELREMIASSSGIGGLAVYNTHIEDEDGSRSEPVLTVDLLPPRFDDGLIGVDWGYNTRAVVAHTVDTINWLAELHSIQRGSPNV